MSLNHRRLIHVPSEVNVSFLQPNLKLYSDAFIARIKHALNQAADGCYTSMQEANATVGLTFPVFVFHGRYYASFSVMNNQDCEDCYAQDLETGEWIRARKISVSASRENNSITHDDFDLLLQHQSTRDEVVRHQNQHVHFFKAKETKIKSTQKPMSMLMLNPDIVIMQEGAKKKPAAKPDGDYVLFTKMIPGMTLAQLISVRDSWPAAMKLNISIMLMSLVSGLHAERKRHGNMSAENIIFRLQKNLETMIRLQGFGMSLAADKLVNQLRDADSNHAVNAAEPDCAALGKILQALWENANLPEPARVEIEGLIDRLMGKTAVKQLDLAKEAVMLGEMKSSQLLPLAETCIPVYLLRISEYLDIIKQGKEVFSAFCRSLREHYLSVRLIECVDEMAPISIHELLQMKQNLERANLVVSDKVYLGTREDALKFMWVKNQRKAVNGMRFVFSAMEPVVEEAEFHSMEEHAGEDVRLLIDDAENVVGAATDVRAGQHEAGYERDDESNSEEDESDDVLDVICGAFSDFTSRVANGCLRAFRPNERAQDSLDASTDGPVHLHTDTAWERVNRIV